MLFRRSISMPPTRSTIGKNNVSKKPRRPRAMSPPSGSPAISDSIDTQHSRATATHVFFWGGILSNWCLTSPPFPGARCLELTVPKLDELKVPHPPPDALSTQILAAHQFMCGEQWMMAAKAWLFERTSILGETPADLDRESESDGSIGRQRFEELKSAVMQAKLPKDFVLGSEEHALYDSTLYAILKSPTPRAQKALGRKVDGFDDAIWNTASTSIVVASCIARAECDAELRKVYREGATKVFVEGSPLDRIWGVGLKWNNPLIDDESNWKGQNRLGKCHNEAARYIKESYTT